MDECANRAERCAGFFYQMHNNGHQICGFYSNAVTGNKVRHRHKEGAICVKKGALKDKAEKYALVKETSGKQGIKEKGRKEAAKEKGRGRRERRDARGEGRKERGEGERRALRQEG